MEEDKSVPPEDKHELRFDFHLDSPPRLRWKTRIGVAYGSYRPQIIAGRIYGWDYDDHLVILDAATGTARERHAILDGITHQTPGVMDDIIYVSARRRGERGHYLCAYDLRRNTLLWKKQTLASWEDPVVHNGTVWIRTTDNMVYALSARDGTIKWVHRLRPESHHSPIRVFNEVVYVGGASKAGFDALGYILALGAAKGDVRWMYATGGEIWCPPVVTNGRVFVTHRSLVFHQFRIFRIYPLGVGDSAGIVA